MATVTKGKTFISGETVEPADMHQLVDSATVTNIVDADIGSGAAIAKSKLAPLDVVNADVNDEAAIAYGKLALTNSIVAGDLTNASVTAAKLDGAQTGSAPIYGCRAWVNFDGTTADNLGGTYSRPAASTDVTIAALAHGLIVGNVVRLDFTSGTGLDGTYTVTQVDDADTFHVTTAASTATSGAVTLLRRQINASGNVSSVTYLNTAGQYHVNFATPMPDANYAIVLGSRNFTVTVSESTPPTAQSLRVLSYNSAPTLVNDGFTSCAIFR